MKAYFLPDFAYQGPRIIVHPLGLPPGWTDSGLTPEREAQALEASRGVQSPNHVVHLDVETLAIVGTFPLK